MHGFRPHRSAQDVLLQLHREVIYPVEHPGNDKVVLALDLRGAFDNVKHDVILTQLSETNCGVNAFQYIRQFLSDRQTYLRIQDAQHVGTWAAPTRHKRYPAGSRSPSPAI